MDDDARQQMDQDRDVGSEPRPGKTTIAHDVLVTIARLSALQTPGVARTSPLPAGVDRIFKRGVEDGVHVAVQDQAVVVDLYLVIQPGYNLREVGRAAQAAVRRAIEEMVGMDVMAVNIHVEDIADQENESTAQSPFSRVAGPLRN
jgi:uncharacterized alkaline shock family protein YloU